MKDIHISIKSSISLYNRRSTPPNRSKSDRVHTHTHPLVGMHKYVNKGCATRKSFPVAAAAAAEAVLVIGNATRRGVAVKHQTTSCR